MTPMTLPAFPPALARLGDRLPALPFSAALAGAMNLAAWRGLAGLDWADLRGRRFCVRVRDLGFPKMPKGLIASPKLLPWLVTQIKTAAPLVEWLVFATA